MKRNCRILHDGAELLSYSPLEHSIATPSTMPFSVREQLSVRFFGTDPAGIAYSQRALEQVGPTAWLSRYAVTLMRGVTVSPGVTSFVDTETVNVILEAFEDYATT